MAKRNNLHALTDSSYVKIFTDGSSHGNPGKSGWAWFVDKENYQCGSSSVSTNQAMELLAIYQALRSVPKNINIEILTDSEFSVNVFTQEIIVAIVKILSSRSGKTVFTHIKAHCGIAGNEIANKMANKMAELQNGIQGKGWTRKEIYVESIPENHKPLPALSKKEKPYIRREIVGSICESCGGQINPLNLSCRCFRD